MRTDNNSKTVWESHCETHDVEGKRGRGKPKEMWPETEWTAKENVYACGVLTEVTFPKFGPRIFLPCPIRTCRTFCTGSQPPICFRCTSGNTKRKSQRTASSRFFFFQTDNINYYYYYCTKHLSAAIQGDLLTSVIRFTFEIARNEKRILSYGDRMSWTQRNQ